MALNRPKDVIRKSGGGLVSVTQETAQQLGQDVGVPAVTSPLQGSTVGANQDQAKMLGTPANLRSAIRARTAPQETLDTALRTQQFEREATEDERAKQARLDKFFENVPGIAQLDEELAKAVKNSLMPGVDASQQILGVDWTAIQAFFADDIPDIEALKSVAEDKIDLNTGLVTEKSLLTRALQGEQLTDAQVNQLTAALEANGLKLEDIKNFVVSPQDQLAEQILNSRATEIRIGDIPQEALDKLGLTNDYLTQLFGTNANGEPMWKGATYEEVKAHIQELQATFSDVRDLQRIANDPFSSASMRREANKRLRELGHLGKRAAMEKVNDLEKQIEDGDTVQIGDATFEIEEILDDDDWQEAIYFAMNDEKAMESLQENNPELAEWIQTNKQALDRQFTTISGRLAPGQNLKDLMVSEEEIEELDVGYVDFDPAFAQNVITELYGETTSWETMTPTQKMEATEEIDARLQGNWDELMTGIDPSFYADRGLDIMNMSPEEMEIAAADIRNEFNTQLFNNSPYPEQFEEYKALLAELGRTEPTMLTPNEWAALPEEEQDLTNKIKDLKDEIKKKNVNGANAVIVDTLAGLNLTEFGIAEQDGVPIELNDTAQVIYDLVQGAKNPTEQAAIKAMANSMAEIGQDLGLPLKSRITPEFWNRTKDQWMSDPEGFKNDLRDQNKFYSEFMASTASEQEENLQNLMGFATGFDEIYRAQEENFLLFAKRVNGEIVNLVPDWMRRTVPVDPSNPYGPQRVEARIVSMVDILRKIRSQLGNPATAANAAKMMEELKAFGKEIDQLYFDNQTKFAEDKQAAEAKREANRQATTLYNERYSPLLDEARKLTGGKIPTSIQISVSDFVNLSPEKQEEFLNKTKDWVDKAKNSPEIRAPNMEKLRGWVTEGMPQELMNDNSPEGKQKKYMYTHRKLSLTYPDFANLSREAQGYVADVVLENRRINTPRGYVHPTKEELAVAIKKYYSQF